MDELIKTQAELVQAMEDLALATAEYNEAMREATSSFSLLDWVCLYALDAWSTLRGWLRA